MEICNKNIFQKDNIRPTTNIKDKVNPTKTKLVLVSFSFSFLALFKRILISTLPDDETSSLLLGVAKGGRSIVLLEITFDFNHFFKTLLILIKVAFSSTKSFIFSFLIPKVFMA